MSQPQRLPGLEDAAITELEDAAREYATIRDERQRLTAHEVELKAKLLRLMKAGKRSLYERDGVKVELVTEEETVKVRVKKDREDGTPATESVKTVRPAAADEKDPDALCRLCSAPNPEFQTTDGRFYYCEAHSANVQEGEQVRRIRDRAKAEVIAESMGREPGDDSEDEPAQDPLLSDAEETGQFVNSRNRGQRRRAKAR